MNAQNSSDTLCFPPEFLMVLEQALTAAHGSGAAANLLRNAGYEAGPGFWAALLEWANLQAESRSLQELSPQEFAAVLSHFFSGHGWGELEHAPLHPGIGALDAPDWREAAAGAGSGNGCAFTTGLLANLLRQLAGEPVAVFEVECRSRNDDRCRFLFGAPETLQLLYGELRDGAEYGEVLAHLV